MSLKIGLDLYFLGKWCIATCFYSFLTRWI